MIVILLAAAYIIYQFVPGMPKLPNLLGGEPSISRLSTSISDYKELLKLSVLDVDMEDAYVEKIDDKTIIYKIPAHCEFKYDMEKVQFEQTDSALTITLPTCEAVVTSHEAPIVYYEEEGRVFGSFGSNVTHEQDKELLKSLQSKICERLKNQYQDLAFEQAENLLTSFYTNTGKKVIVNKKN